MNTYIKRQGEDKGSTMNMTAFQKMRSNLKPTVGENQKKD